jgi:dephospho-CoA kinase
MIVIGLTGSIGMGKSTAAAALRRLGVPVHEADMEVHALLSANGKAVTAVAEAVSHHPGIYKRSFWGKKFIDRSALGKIVFQDDALRLKLENILHPLVREGQNIFIKEENRKSKKIIALDIPLLFETGGEARVDYTMVVTAPEFIQRERVMARKGMNEKKFQAILARQMPDAQKQAKADYVVHTGAGRARMMQELKAALRDIQSKTHG